MSMEIFGPLLLTIISGLSTMIGIIPIYFKIEKVDNLISFTLALSYIILLSISLFDLIPNSLKIILNNYSILKSIISSIIIFLFGYILIYIMSKREGEKSLYKIGIISLISIVLHNIPEGIVVFMSSYKSIKLGFKTVIAIMMHNIPEGLLISIPLYYSNKSRGSVILKMIIASISEPLGALLSYFILRNNINDIILSYILLFVSGIMISLCFNEIFPELLKYNKKRYILFGIEVSIILIIILSMLN